MARREVVLTFTFNARSGAITRALAAGAARVGWKATRVMSSAKDAVRPGALHVFYGIKENWSLIDRLVGCDYLFFDLGYWGRTNVASDRSGTYRGALNAFHPTPEQLARTPRRPSRLARYPIDWKRTRPPGTRMALIAGMSEKAASVYGYGPLEWETQVAADLTAAGWRPYYRRKPSWDGPQAVPGAVTLDPAVEDVTQIELADLVVSHHSNMGLLALAKGRPIYSEAGITLPWSLPHIPKPHEFYDTPSEETAREALEKAAAWQWSIQDMMTGTIFRDLEEGGFL